MHCPSVYFVKGRSRRGVGMGPARGEKWTIYANKWWCACAQHARSNKTSGAGFVLVVTKANNIRNKILWCAVNEFTSLLHRPTKRSTGWGVHAWVVYLGPTRCLVIIYSATGPRLLNHTTYLYIYSWGRRWAPHGPYHVTRIVALHFNDCELEYVKIDWI
jgi:hypothetical protein